MDSIKLVLISRVAPALNIPTTTLKGSHDLERTGSPGFAPPAGELATVQDVDEIRHY